VIGLSVVPSANVGGRMQRGLFVAVVLVLSINKNTSYAVRPTWASSDRQDSPYFCSGKHYRTDPFVV